MPSPTYTPLAPIRIREPFDHSEWLWEWKADGFRALAYFEHGTVRLVSRRGNVYKRFDALRRPLADALPVRTAVLDAEIVVLDNEGRSQFTALLRGRGEPVLYAFDLLELNGKDLRDQALVERKRVLRGIVPRGHSHIFLADHVAERGVDLFREICARNLEGIVGKWARSPYRMLDGRSPWVKVRNPSYTEMDARYDLFAGRGGRRG